MKKISYSLLAVAVTVAGIALPAASASAADDGGWSEETGAFVSQPNRLQGGSRTTITSTPHHTGQSEKKTISGTTNKRAHGWTTWTGVYHYTTARQECGSNVLATSGRQWGTNGTEAISPWVPFNPYAPCNGYGSSRTYYGH